MNPRENKRPLILFMTILVATTLGVIIVKSQSEKHQFLSKKTQTQPTNNSHNFILQTSQPKIEASWVYVSSPKWEISPKELDDSFKYANVQFLIFHPDHTFSSVSCILYHRLKPESLYISGGDDFVVHRGTWICEGNNITASFRMTHGPRGRIISSQKISQWTSNVDCIQNIDNRTLPISLHQSQDTYTNIDTFEFNDLPGVLIQLSGMISSNNQ